MNTEALIARHAKQARKSFTGRTLAPAHLAESRTDPAAERIRKANALALPGPSFGDRVEAALRDYTNAAR